MSVIEFFEKLGDEAMQDMFSIHYPEGLGDEELVLPEDREKINDLLANDAVASGIDSAFDHCKQEDLDSLVDDLKLTLPEGKNRSKPVLKKALFNYATEKEDTEEFLKELSADSLKRLASALSVQPTTEDVAEWIGEHGLSLFLSQFGVAELRQWMTDSGVKNVGNINNKKVAVEAFIKYEKPLVPKKKAKKEPHLSKKKPDLVKGVSGADIFQWYTKEEIVKYIHQKEIPVPVSVKFRVLANNLSSYLSGTYVKPEKKRKRKRASENSKKAKKAKTEKDSGKKGTEKEEGSAEIDDKEDQEKKEPEAETKKAKTEKESQPVEEKQPAPKGKGGRKAKAKAGDQ